MPISFLRAPVFCFLLACLFVAIAPTPSPAQSQQAAVLSKEQQDARDALNQGVQAFKNAQIDEAVRLFARAKQLDPTLQNASLYLATAYASYYIPGAPSDENVERGKMAVSEYKDVLAMDATNLSAIDGVAAILYQMAGQPFNPELFEESKSYHKRHIELKPDDPQPYFSVGMIDWALAYRGNTVMRAEFNSSVGVKTGQGTHRDDDPIGLKDTDPLPEVIRGKYVEDFGATIDEGIDSLKHAIELKPDYDDAMTYLNLLYRRKADITASAAERNELINMADELLDQVKDLKMKRAAVPAEPNR